MQNLRPTLWRTCRILANPIRLDLLRELFSDKELSVTALATCLGLSEKTAGIYLRSISARGLISSRPAGRWVFYTATANPSVDYANTLLSLVRECCKTGIANEEIIHYVTAFTHQRRIDIVGQLQEKTIAVQELSLATQISPPALHRHLRKLIDREMVERSGKHYTLKTPSNLLGKALLQAAIS
jgi:DNA-binding transcriptional ArsR family regulator